MADNSGTPCPSGRGKLVETGEGRTPRPESTLGGIYYRLSQLYCFAYEDPCRRGFTRRLAEGSIGVLGTAPQRIAPIRLPWGGNRGRSRLSRRLVLAACRQLLFRRRINEVDGTSACNPEDTLPVETARPRARHCNRARRQQVSDGRTDELVYRRT